MFSPQENPGQRQSSDSQPSHSQREMDEFSLQCDQPGADSEQLLSISLASKGAKMTGQRSDTGTSDEDDSGEERQSSLCASRRYLHPSEFESALLAAIEADRQTAHLSSSEYELSFSIPFVSKPSEKLAIVGSLDLLGGWNPTNSLEMDWTTGHIWRLTINLAEGQLPQFHYKFLCITPTTVRWEGGQNRCFTPEHFSAVRGPKVIYEIAATWQNCH